MRILTRLNFKRLRGPAALISECPERGGWSNQVIDMESGSVERSSVNAKSSSPESRIMEDTATPEEEAQRAVNFRIADLREKDIGKVPHFFCSQTIF